MAKKTASKAETEADTQARQQPAEPAPGFTTKAGDMVQTILGTMAGVVEGIGILVTGTEAEKRAKAAAAKKARTPVKSAGKGPTAKKLTSKKAPAAKKVAAKKTAKKAVPKKAAKQAGAKKTAAKETAH